jgi:hypothetical protein
MLEIEKLKALIWLLEQENEALRSVLSEWDQDKSCFIQMNKADNIRAVLDGVRK